MYVVNLFAQPGAGKSTGAAYIFAKLKMAGVNAELITEFAKDKVWEENKEVFKNQAYLFGKQYYRMSRCKDKVDVLVTDSPLLLSILYNEDETLGREFNAVVGNVFNSFNNLNYWINRVKPYNPKGRHQTEEEADGLIPILRFIMRDNHVEWTEYRGIEEDYDKIVEDVLRHLEEFNKESMERCSN